MHIIVNIGLKPNCNDKIEGVDRSLKLLYFTIVQDLNWVILTIEY